MFSQFYLMSSERFKYKLSMQEEKSALEKKNSENNIKMWENKTVKKIFFSIWSK